MSAKPALIKTALNQTTYSQDHKWFFYKNRGLTGKGIDIGGAFRTERFVYKPEYPRDKYFTADIRVGSGYYAGGNLSVFSPNLSQQNYLKSLSRFATDSEMDSWGTTAVSKTIPTKAPVELATTAAELLSGGLPKILGAGLLKSVIKDHRNVGRHVKSGADEYLNLEFGIKPLIGDLIGTAKSIVSAAERIQQLERDSGRLVRRKFRFPLREDVTITNSSGVYPPGWSYTYLWNTGGVAGNRLERHITVRQDRWFSGAFTYHLDLGARHRDQLYAAADNARLLLGVKLDAEVLWNLTPWSWLADWFGNVGDIATNVSHFSRDGLVMPYGYMMAKTEVIDWQRMSNLNWYKSMPRSVTDSMSYVRKQRSRATPFGFGLTDMVLDQRQVSILGALGLSKAPRLR
jgi:hypothetical protein